MNTDGCDKQTGCVFLQNQNVGSNRPIGYWSCTLKDKKRQFAKKLRELLHAVWAVILLHAFQ